MLDGEPISMGTAVKAGKTFGSVSKIKTAGDGRLWVRVLLDSGDHEWFTADELSVAEVDE